MCIPKNFTLSIYLTSVFRNRMRGLKGGFERQRWNDIVAVLVVFMERSFLRNQFSNCFMTKDNLVCRASSFLSTTHLYHLHIESILLLEYLMGGHWYILKIKGVPKLSRVVYHMKSPLMKIEICVGWIYFYLFEIFQQIAFCLLRLKPLIHRTSNSIWV